MENMPVNDENVKIIYVDRIIYRTDSMKRSQKKYMENNKEKIKQITKKYYDSIKHTEDFKEKVRQQKKNYYQNHKAQLKEEAKVRYYLKKMKDNNDENNEKLEL